MGTNYYTTCLGKLGGKEHLGKSSVGWRFLLRGNKDSCYAETVSCLNRVDTVIVDEYDVMYSPFEMLQIIESGQRCKSHTDNKNVFTDYLGFEFCTEEFS